MHTAQAQPANAGSGTTDTMASLQADLVNAQARSARQAARIRQLEKKLSEMLGDQAWRDSGLGAPDDIDQLKRRIVELEQEIVDLKEDLTEREQELNAARETNRDLITQLNRA